MNYWKQLTVIILSCILITGCERDRFEARGFSLPEGNVEKGKEAFSALQCNSCHSTSEIEQLPSNSDERRVTYKLGGEVSTLKTYGELVTSIINPSHRIARPYAPQHSNESGQSAMRNLNQVMTVEQLIDLVSFLQTQYHFPDFERTQYRAYKH